MPIGIGAIRDDACGGEGARPNGNRADYGATRSKSPGFQLLSKAAGSGP